MVRSQQMTATMARSRMIIKQMVKMRFKTFVLKKEMTICKTTTTKGAKNSENR